MTELPVIPDAVAAAARHGSYCPKLCNHVCPVLAATGRDDAQPWSFHRAVTDLADGRVPTDDVGHRLDACTGCHACRVPCVFDQDVPAQVRAGRAAVVAAGTPPEHTRTAVARAAAGTSPFTGAPPPVRQDGSATSTVVVPGCRDDHDTIAAVVRLLAAAGVPADVAAPWGCCGGALDDLGADDAADERRAALAPRLEPADRVVALDPHCLGSLRRIVGDGTTVVDAVSAVAGALEAAAIGLTGALGPVAFHDPCLLARDEAVTAPPRALLASIGGELVEPEGHGVHTVCSGAGMAFELVDEPAADSTARRRASQLGATGAPVVTACAGARHRLTAAGITVHDLFTLLAERLDDGPRLDPPASPHRPPAAPQPSTEPS